DRVQGLDRSKSGCGPLGFFFAKIPGGDQDNARTESINLRSLIWARAFSAVVVVVAVSAAVFLYLRQSCETGPPPVRRANVVRPSQRIATSAPGSSDLLLFRHKRRTNPH